MLFLLCEFRRCQEVSKRKEYVSLVESVRDAGGEVKIFSSMHISGQREYFQKMAFHRAQWAPNLPKHHDFR